MNSNYIYLEWKHGQPKLLSPVPIASHHKFQYQKFQTNLNVYGVGLSYIPGFT